MRLEYGKPPVGNDKEFNHQRKSTGRNSEDRERPAFQSFLAQLEKLLEGRIATTPSDGQACSAAIVFGSPALVEWWIWGRKLPDRFESCRARKLPFCIPIIAALGSMIFFKSEWNRVAERCLNKRSRNGGKIRRFESGDYRHQKSIAHQAEICTRTIE